MIRMLCVYKFMEVLDNGPYLVIYIQGPRLCCTHYMATLALHALHGHARAARTAWPRSRPTTYDYIKPHTLLKMQFTLPPPMLKRTTSIGDEEMTTTISSESIPPQIEKGENNEATALNYLNNSRLRQYVVDKLNPAIDFSQSKTFNLFKNLYDHGKINVIAETDNYYAFVPARNGKPLEIDDTANGPASLLHALVCFKEGNIANAVDTKQMEKFDFGEAKKCGKLAIDALKGDLSKAGLKERLAEVNAKMLWSAAHPNAQTFEEAIKNSEPVEYAFHLYPHNSVDDIHMHVYCPKLATRSFDHQIKDNEFKYTPVDALLDVIKHSKA